MAPLITDGGATSTKLLVEVLFLWKFSKCGLIKSQRSEKYISRKFRIQINRFSLSFCSKLLYGQ